MTQQPRCSTQLREGPHVPVLGSGQLNPVTQTCKGCRLGTQSLCGRAGKEQVGNLWRWWESFTSYTQEGEKNCAKPQIKPESFATKRCCWGANMPG